MNIFKLKYMYVFAMHMFQTNMSNNEYKVQTKHMSFPLHLQYIWWNRESSTVAIFRPFLLLQAYTVWSQGTVLILSTGRHFKPAQFLLKRYYHTSWLVLICVWKKINVKAIFVQSILCEMVFTQIIFAWKLSQWKEKCFLV